MAENIAAIKDLMPIPAKTITSNLPLKDREREADRANSIATRSLTRQLKLNEKRIQLELTLQQQGFAISNWNFINNVNQIEKCLKF